MLAIKKREIPAFQEEKQYSAWNFKERMHGYRLPEHLLELWQAACWLEWHRRNWAFLEEYSSPSPLSLADPMGLACFSTCPAGNLVSLLPKTEIFIYAMASKTRQQFVINSTESCGKHGTRSIFGTCSWTSAERLLMKLHSWQNIWASVRT